jgi:hypothetical protein
MRRAAVDLGAPVRRGRHARTQSGCARHRESQKGRTFIEYSRIVLGMSTQIRRDTANSGVVPETPYSLDSITRSPSPFADDERDWHSYVIGRGNNRIVGHRPGSAESVRLAAEDLVSRLNERRNFRSGGKKLVIGPAKNT